MYTLSSSYAHPAIISFQHEIITRNFYQSRFPPVFSGSLFTASVFLIETVGVVTKTKRKLMTGGDSSFGHQGPRGGIYSSGNRYTYGSPFSCESSSGAFGPDANEYMSQQNHPWQPGYDDPPILVHRHHERSRRVSCRAFLFWWTFTISIGVVLGSLWILFVFYGSKHLEMGLHYSRLLKANGLLVQGITVQNHDPAPGPLLYHFGSQPSLDDQRKWTIYHDGIVEGFYHEEWDFWLNQGSEVKLKYDIQRNSSLFAIAAQGKSNFRDCIQQPGGPGRCLLWRPVQGHGKIEFEAMKDADYYIGMVNPHQMNMEIMLKMKIKAKVYETNEADFFCPLDAKPCTIDLSLRGSEVGLVTTPDEPQEGIDVWHVTISYDTRWAAYAVIYGALALLLLAICSCRPRSRRITVFHPEIAPLNLQTGAATYSVGPPAVATLSPYNETHLNISSGADRVTEEIPDENLCTICFKQQKNSFFHPCGHCTTCYNCGRRVKEMSEKCPICRQPIQDVRKIFIS